MMKYRQVLSGAVLAGALALPAAELVRVDFSRGMRRSRRAAPVMCRVK